MASEYIHDQDARAATVAALCRLLADTYLIYTKTQGFHWNVVGPQFEPLHALFQEQYTELSAAIDEIAERIRALNVKAPGSFSEFKSVSTIAEETRAPAAEAMIRQLAADHATAARTALQTVTVAEASGDISTVDIATQRVTQHEKVAWMLGSFLQR